MAAFVPFSALLQPAMVEKRVRPLEVEARHPRHVPKAGSDFSLLHAARPRVVVGKSTGTTAPGFHDVQECRALPTSTSPHTSSPLSARQIQTARSLDSVLDRFSRRASLITPREEHPQSASVLPSDDFPAVCGKGSIDDVSGSGFAARVAEVEDRLRNQMLVHKALDAALADADRLAARVAQNRRRPAGMPLHLRASVGPLLHCAPSRYCPRHQAVVDSRAAKEVPPPHVTAAGDPGNGTVAVPLPKATHDTKPEANPGVSSAVAAALAMVRLGKKNIAEAQKAEEERKAREAAEEAKRKRLANIVRPPSPVRPYVRIMKCRPRPRAQSAGVGPGGLPLAPSRGSMVPRRSHSASPQFRASGATSIQEEHTLPRTRSVRSEGSVPESPSLRDDATHPSVRVVFGERFQLPDDLAVVTDTSDSVVRTSLSASENTSPTVSDKQARLEKLLEKIERVMRKKRADVAERAPRKACTSRFPTDQLESFLQNARKTLLEAEASRVRRMQSKARGVKKALHRIRRGEHLRRAIEAEGIDEDFDAGFSFSRSRGRHVRDEIADDIEDEVVHSEDDGVDDDISMGMEADFEEEVEDDMLSEDGFFSQRDSVADDVSIGEDYFDGASDAEGIHDDAEYAHDDSELEDGAAAASLLVGRRVITGRAKNRSKSVTKPPHRGVAVTDAMANTVFEEPVDEVFENVEVVEEEPDSPLEAHHKQSMFVKRSVRCRGSLDPTEPRDLSDTRHRAPRRIPSRSSLANSIRDSLPPSRSPTPMSQRSSARYVTESSRRGSSEGYSSDSSREGKRRPLRKSSSKSSMQRRRSESSLSGAASSRDVMPDETMSSAFTDHDLLFDTSDSLAGERKRVTTTHAKAAALARQEFRDRQRRRRWVGAFGIPTLEELHDGYSQPPPPGMIDGESGAWHEPKDHHVVFAEEHDRPVPPSEEPNDGSVPRRDGDPPLSFSVLPFRTPTVASPLLPSVPPEGSGGDSDDTSATADAETAVFVRAKDDVPPAAGAEEAAAESLGDSRHRAAAVQGHWLGGWKDSHLSHIRAELQKNEVDSPSDAAVESAAKASSAHWLAVETLLRRLRPDDDSSTPWGDSDDWTSESGSESNAAP